MELGVTVIILTYNEEANVGKALSSLCHWASEVFIVDSFSTDKTIEIAKTNTCTIVQHAFQNYSDQRNWALSELPIKTEWVLFLDADEYIPEQLRDEILKTIASKPQENGFFIKYRLLWMGRWIKRGYYPTFLLRLFRKGKGKCEERALGEHFIVEGKIGFLHNDFIHEDHKGLGAWIDKHNAYATREAEEFFNKKNNPGLIQASRQGNQAQRKRWIKNNIWDNLPPLIRPCIYFFYRYIVRGGFLDGWEGFSFHFLQALWFQTLIDIKYLEIKRMQKQTNDFSI